MRTQTRRRVRHTLAALAAVLVLPLAACATGNSSLAPADIDRAAESADVEPAVDGSTATEYGTAIIQTGDVSIEVADTEAAAHEVVVLAERLGGFVASQSITNEDEWSPPSATLTLRVPTDEFDSAFDAFEDVGQVLAQNRSADDVTAQHADLEARVDALDASVERLTELMSGAASTADLIEAEAALSERQQELDGLRAQLATLEDQVAYGTVTVSLGEEAAALPGGPTNFWEGVVAGFGSLGAAGAGALVVLGLLTPWLLVAAVVTFVIIVIVKSERRRRARTRRD